MSEGAPTTTAALWAHVPMPLALPGSAITSVVKELTVERAARGGRTVVVVADNRGEQEIQGADVELVDYTHRVPRQFFSRRELLTDVLAGAFLLERPYQGRLQLPAMAALHRAGPEVIFIHEGHYAATTLRRWRKEAPSAAIYLYVHNTLSRTMSRRELCSQLSATDGIVCVSSVVAEHVRDRCGEPAPIHVVNNGTREPVANVGVGSDGELNVLFAGQVSPHKGPGLLVEAAVEVNDPRLNLTIIGSSVHGQVDFLSTYEKEMRKLARRSSSRINFVSFMPRAKLQSKFEGADLVAVPSLFDDPCPLVLLEAMRSGAAVAAHSRGGIPEIGGSAVLYVEQAAGAWSELFSKALANRETLVSCAQRCLTRAGELSWGKQYESLLRIVDAGGQRA